LLRYLEIGVADIKGDIKVLDEKIEGIDNRLRLVEGTQKNQVWTLIILLGSAIVTVCLESIFFKQYLSSPILNKTTVNPTKEDKTLFLVDCIFLNCLLANTKTAKNAIKYRFGHFFASNFS
jgi:hypothetical protein